MAGISRTGYYLSGLFLGQEGSEGDGNNGERRAGNAANKKQSKSPPQPTKNHKGTFIPAYMRKHNGNCHLFAPVYVSTVEFEWQFVFEQ